MNTTRDTVSPINDADGGQPALMVFTIIFCLTSPGILWCFKGLIRNKCSILFHQRGRFLISAYTKVTSTPTKKTDEQPKRNNDHDGKSEATEKRSDYKRNSLTATDEILQQTSPSSVDIAAIVQFDDDTLKILGFSLQYSLATATKTLFPSIILVFVSRFLGTEAVSAYSVSELVLTLSREFTAAIVSTGGVLCSQAVGIGNAFLGGQYIQVSSIIYLVAQVLFFITWSLCMGSIMTALGYSPKIAQMARHYSSYAVVRDGIKGQNELFNYLLGVLGHEQYTSFMISLGGVIEVGCVGLSVAVYRLELRRIPVFQLVLHSCFLLVSFSFTYFKKWINPCLKGMLGNCALKNLPAVQRIIFNSVPLGIGNLFNYGEWLILAVFASSQGTIATTSWAMFSSIWEACEILMIGIGDAGEVQSAHHMGEGKPETAKISAYRTLLFGVVCASVTALIFSVLGGYIPALFTDDELLQASLGSLTPYLVIGASVLPFVLISWALLGGQCRYRTAMLVISGASWLMTIPLGAIFTFSFNYGVDGLAAAIVMGYTSAGAVLTNILFSSDWERITRDIQEEMNECEDEVELTDEDGMTAGRSKPEPNYVSNDDFIQEEEEETIELA